MSDIYKMWRVATAEWLFLDWHAQWLFYTIASKCDAQGVIALGRHGRPALAAIIGNTTWEAIDASFGSLVRDGFVECADDRIVVAHFAEWQQCPPTSSPVMARALAISEARRMAGRMGGVASGTSRRAMASSDQRQTWSKSAYPDVFIRDNYTCRYCGARRKLSVDHVIPRIQGGGDEQSNLVVACKSCNSRKGGRTPEQADMTLRPIPGAVS